MPTSSNHHVSNNGKTPVKHHQDEIDTDPEELEDVVGESEESDPEEDLPLELDEGRGSNKKDEMEVEHLATLERLRQTQRQDYLRVSSLLLHFVFGTFILIMLCFVYREAYRAASKQQIV